MTCSEVGWIHKEAKFERGLWPLLCGAQWLDPCLEDSDTRPSDVEAKKLKLTFVVMIDGINENYFKGLVKAKTKEEKPQFNSLARRKAQSLIGCRIASSDAKLSFDELIQKTFKV